MNTRKQKKDIKHYFAGTERILAGVGGGGQPLIETDAELRTITGEKPRDLAGRYMEFVRHYFNDISNQTACIKNEIIYDAEINIPSMQELFKNVVYAHNPDKLYYFNANHLGSGSLITDKYGQTYQTLIYAPHGEVLFNKFYGDYDEPYKFTGYEKDNESGLNYAKARYQDPSIGFNSTDAMWYLSPHQSSYTYAGNNPIKYIDPDGNVVRLANNYAGGMANIAQIAATSLGSQVMSHLIGRNETYTMNSTFLTRSSGYDPSNGDINYVGNPWYSEIPFDGGALNSMIAMGHETFHAFDQSNNVFDEAHAAYSTGTTEPRAVSFGNYLREAYSLSPLRERYGNIQGNFHQFADGEKISNFTTLGNNADKTSYGFSYTKTTTIVESYKQYGWGRVPDKTRTETANYYMVVSMDKNNNVSYQIYNSEKAYKNATDNW